MQKLRVKDLKRGHIFFLGPARFMVLRKTETTITYARYAPHMGDRCISGEYYEIGARSMQIVLVEKLLVKPEVRIMQVDKDGNIIGEFMSLRDAESNTGVRLTKISDCLRGRQLTAGGYKWKKIAA